MSEITFNTHGKGRVRLVKVVRGADGTHIVHQYNVQLLLEGDVMKEAFYTGANDNVVPTDTCKNTVYCLAKLHNFESMEEFALIICKHFLTTYPHVCNKINVDIKKDVWERITTTTDSKGRVAPHKHCFKKVGPMQPFTRATGEKRANTRMKLSLISGFTNFEVLKSTQSGFVDFHKCKYTSLPEVKDRFLGTSVTAEWTYSPRIVENPRFNYNASFNNIMSNMVQTLTGPSDTGIYSPSVQQTLYFMGQSALEKERSIDNVTLRMPNLHVVPFNLETYGLKNKDHTGYPDIFFPIDEPHGMIQATVVRTNKARL